MSPRRRRCGLYFLLSPKNIQHPEVCAFLRNLLRHLRGPVIVIWDNGTIHGGEAIRELQTRYPRLHLYRFPGYAPELNPDEGVWQLTKRTLANGRPDSQRGSAILGPTSLINHVSELPNVFDAVSGHPRPMALHRALADRHVMKRFVDFIPTEAICHKKIARLCMFVRYRWLFNSIEKPSKPLSLTIKTPRRLLELVVEPFFEGRVRLTNLLSNQIKPHLIVLDRSFPVVHQVEIDMEKPVRLDDSIGIPSLLVERDQRMVQRFDFVWPVEVFGDLGRLE